MQSYYLKQWLPGCSILPKTYSANRLSGKRLMGNACSRSPVYFAHRSIHQNPLIVFFPMSSSRNLWAMISHGGITMPQFISYCAKPPVHHKSKNVSKDL